MRIAYLCDVIYPWFKGGGEKRNYEIARRLAKLGFEPHIFGLKWWKGRNTIKKDGIILHGIIKAPKQIYRGRRRSIKTALAYSLALIPTLAKERFDIIECYQSPFIHTVSAKLISLLKGIPLFFTWHEVWGDYWEKYLWPFGYFAKILERIVLRFPQKIITVSEKGRRELIKAGVRKDKIVIIPNGIDLELIKKVKPSKEKFDAIYVGRLVKDKNVDVLLEAIALVRRKKPKIRVAIVGDGPERKYLESLAEKLNVKKNVKFFGFVERYEDVISLMKSSKVFVLPSTREGFSIVSLEAMACGLPVIAIKGQIGIKIRDGIDGFLVRLDAREIADKIAKAMKLGKIKSDYVRGFGWERVTMKVVDLILGIS